MTSIEQSSDQNPANDVVPDSCLASVQSLAELSSIPKTKQDHEAPIQQTSPSWFSPLCTFCKTIFDQWDKFLLNTEHQVPHYGLFSEVKASAENGCSLCTQFVRAAQIQFYRDRASLNIYSELPSGTAAELAKDEETYLVSPDLDVAQSSMLNARNASSEVPPDQRSEGHVTMSCPGEGHGSIENAYRLHLSELNIPIFLLNLEFKLLGS